MLKTKLILPDSSTNDNRSINGVLPKIEEFLNKAGIKTEAQWKATWECPLYDTKDLQSKNQDELSDFEKQWYNAMLMPKDCEKSRQAVFRF